MTEEDFQSKQQEGSNRAKDQNSAEKNKLKNELVGVSRGLVVTGGDSYSKGCEFGFQHCILDGHFLTFICCKSCNVY